MKRFITSLLNMAMGTAIVLSAVPAQAQLTESQVRQYDADIPGVRSGYLIIAADNSYVIESSICNYSGRCWFIDINEQAFPITPIQAQLRFNLAYAAYYGQVFVVIVDECAEAHRVNFHLVPQSMRQCP